MPGRTVEDAEYWKGSPTKYRPASEETTPRSCKGIPSPSKMGRSIHEKSFPNPVHQITLVTSRTRPSARTGRPSRTPATFDTRSTPAARSSFGLIRTRMSPLPASFTITRRPIGVRIVST